MGSEWKKVEFGDAKLQILDGDRGKNYPKRTEFKDKGHCLFLNTGNVTKNGFLFENKDFIGIERDNLLRKGKLKRNDIVLTTRGTVGNVGFYSNDINYEHIRINSGMVILRVNKDYIYPSFLYQFVKSQIFKSQVLNFQTGSAQPQLPIRDLKRMLLNLPPLPEQKKIAHILGSLDDKIELNRQMNQTLEAMAQALFKSWFVDFDPVIDKALQAGNLIPEELQRRAEMRKNLVDKQELPEEIMALFPDGFEYSEELGKFVPCGWEAGNIGKLIKAQGGYAFKSKEFSDNGRPVVKIKNIKSDGTVDLLDVTFYAGEITEKINKIELNDGDIVMAMTGATVCKSGIIVIENKKPLLNQRVARMQNIDRNIPSIWYSYLLFNQSDRLEELIDLASGSAQPNISSKQIESLACIIPNTSLLIKFNSIVDNYFEKQINNIKEIKKLTKLRDTLLPKLVSGEVRV